MKFKAERFAPFEDLLKLIRIREGLSVIDLGCGTGALTRRLADALPGSDVLGIDASREMLQEAKQHAGPRLAFKRETIQSVDGRWDLVFSNAAIQWVPDHHALIPRLLTLLNPGGQLTAQLPSNHHHPAHRTIVEVAGEEPFRTALKGWVRTFPVLGVDDYAVLLHEHGGEEIEVFEKVYPHIMRDADALVEWISGTALVPYFNRLSNDVKAAFLSEFRSRLRRRYPSGEILYPFRRTLFSALKPSTR